MTTQEFMIKAAKTARDKKAKEVTDQPILAAAIEKAKIETKTETTETKTEDKKMAKKRVRRTKAQIEAAKAAQVVTPKAAPVATQKAAPVATPKTENDPVVDLIMGTIQNQIIGKRGKQELSYIWLTMDDSTRLSIIKPVVDKVEKSLAVTIEKAIEKAISDLVRSKIG